MRLRRQKEVQKENEYYYEFLREALPPGPVRDEAFNINPQPSPKPCKYFIKDLFYLWYLHFDKGGSVEETLVFIFRTYRKFEFSHQITAFLFDTVKKF